MMKEFCCATSWGDLKMLYIILFCFEGKIRTDLNCLCNPFVHTKVVYGRVSVNAVRPGMILNGHVCLTYLDSGDDSMPTS